MGGCCTVEVFPPLSCDSSRLRSGLFWVMKFARPKIFTLVCASG